MRMHAGRQQSHSINAGAYTVSRLDAGAFGAAGGDEVAGIEREVIAVEAHEFVRPVAHVADKVARADAVVVFSDDFERIHLGHLVSGHNHRTEAEEGVDTLGAG